MSCNVDYWQHYTDGRPSLFQQGQACFCWIPWTAVTKIDYLARPKDGMTDEHVRFWDAFLRTWLVELPWTIELTADAAGGRRWLFKLLACSPNSRKTLLYLSAFRYLDEFSNVVRALYDARDQDVTPEARFLRFYRIQVEGQTKAGEYGQVVTCDEDRLINIHGLVCLHERMGTSSETPVAMADVMANLAASTSTRVHSFFRPLVAVPAPAAVPAPVVPVQEVRFVAEEAPIQPLEERAVRPWPGYNPDPMPDFRRLYPMPELAPQPL